MVACAVGGADRAAAKASGNRGYDGACTDTLAAMNVTAAAAAAAASDRQRGEGDTMDERDEYSGGTRGDWDMDEGNSSRKTCLPHGHVLMRQAVVPDEWTTTSCCQILEPVGYQKRFLWFSGDTIGHKHCKLENGENLLLVRPKRLVFRYAAVHATID